MKKRTRIVLLDNGSLDPKATLGLRLIAVKLGQKIDSLVSPVSARYANRIAPELLDGRNARVWKTFLDEELEKGEREFLVLPLFFGESDALVGYVSEVIKEAQAIFGDLRVEFAQPLVDLKDSGDRAIANLLASQILQRLSGENHDRKPYVVLVDHGSPSPAVTHCRNRVATQMNELLGDVVAEVFPCSMEKREGPEYDFNKPLLEDLLNRLASESVERPIYLSYMFLFPGRHAGVGGDIDQICSSTRLTTLGRELVRFPLVGDSPELVGILEKRYAQVVSE